MFTGIVEEIGIVLAATTAAARDNTLHIACQTVVSDARIGDSIAVNGTCLTVTAFDPTSFTVGTAPETLSRTNLGRLRAGDLVNLERSVRADGRMGGHYVQGHVDDTATITAIVPEGESLRITIAPPARLLPYIVEKGYIAVDGVSLTVAARSATTFTIALIAHTQSAVIMGHQPVGTLVNIEVDILAKYVEQFIGGTHYATR